MSEFWKRKVRTLFCTLDCNKDGYISETDYANMARDYADAHEATPEEKDNLVTVFINLWRKYMKAGDFEKESRLTLPVLIESLKQQLYDPELITCLVQVMRGLFELMDVKSKGYLRPDEHKSIFTFIGVPEGTFDEKTAFDAMDTNEDGKVSFDEFIAGCLDFMFSEDETSPNRFFFGSLLD